MHVKWIGLQVCEVLWKEWHIVFPLIIYCTISSDLQSYGETEGQKEGQVKEGNEYPFVFHPLGNASGTFFFHPWVGAPKEPQSLTARP